MNATATRSRKQVQRHAQIGAAVNGVSALKLTIGTQTFGYYLKRIPSAWGIAFQLDKFSVEVKEDEPSSYVLLIDQAGGQHQCECLGQQKWGHRHPCKHLACLLSLIQRGKLDASPIPAA